MKLLIFFILIISDYGYAGFFSRSYPSQEIEIGNLLQHGIKKWENTHSRKPSFIQLENIMRASGCYVSYHRCFYKNRYYKVSNLLNNDYPKIDISKIVKPTKKRSNFNRSYTEHLIYKEKRENILKKNVQKKKNNNSMKNIKLSNEIGNPNSYIGEKNGVTPNLPSIKTHIGIKPFPRIYK